MVSVNPDKDPTSETKIFRVSASKDPRLDRKISTPAQAGEAFCAALEQALPELAGKLPADFNLAGSLGALYLTKGQRAIGVALVPHASVEHEITEDDPRMARAIVDLMRMGVMSKAKKIVFAALLGGDPENETVSRVFMACAAACVVSQITMLDMILIGAPEQIPDDEMPEGVTAPHGKTLHRHRVVSVSRHIGDKQGGD